MKTISIVAKYDIAPNFSWFKGWTILKGKGVIFLHGIGYYRQC